MVKRLAKLLLIGVLVAGAQIDRLGPHLELWLSSGSASATASPGVPLPRVEGERASGMKTVERVVTLATETAYDALIERHASRTGLRPALVRAVIEVESAFDPNARSQVGAMGLMQLMPATARELGVADPFNPDENVRGGTTYLAQLLSRFRGDEMLGLAAYNAGPGAVDRYGERVPPFPETEQYVKNVQAAAEDYVVREAGVSDGTVEKTYMIDDGWWTVVYTTYQASSTIQ